MNSASNVIASTRQERLESQPATLYRCLTHGVRRSSYNRSSSGRAVLVALVLVSSGCASVGEGLGGAAGGATGAAAGLVAGLACGPAFIVCSPLYAIQGLEGGAKLGAQVGRAVGEQIDIAAASAKVASNDAAPAQPAGAEAQDGSAPQPASDPSENTAESPPMSSAQNAEQPVATGGTDAPEPPLTTATLATGAAIPAPPLSSDLLPTPAPQPVASLPSVAGPSDLAQGSPLPAVGTTWLYQVADKMYGRKRTSLTVDVVRANNQIVEERLSATAGATHTREIQRAIDVRSSRFLEYPVGASSVLLEFAPYLLIARGEEAFTEAFDAAGYPTSGDSNWITESKPPIWEQVTVPAGTFRAQRLEISGRRERSPFSNQVTTRFLIHVWYAPEVRRYVRLEHKEWVHPGQNSDVAIELMKFSPPS